MYGSRIEAARGGGGGNKEEGGSQGPGVKDYVFLDGRDGLVTYS